MRRPLTNFTDALRVPPVTIVIWAAIAHTLGWNDLAWLSLGAAGIASLIMIDTSLTRIERELIGINHHTQEPR